MRLLSLSLTENHRKDFGVCWKCWIMALIKEGNERDISGKLRKFITWIPSNPALQNHWNSKKHLKIKYTRFSRHNWANPIHCNAIQIMSAITKNIVPTYLNTKVLIIHAFVGGAFLYLNSAEPVALSPPVGILTQSVNIWKISSLEQAAG